MVALTFNAGSVQPATDTDITITFGNGKSHLRWSDRRTMRFDEFARILQDSPVGVKDGACYTPASLRGTRRHLTETDQIDIAVLDSDSGHTLEEISAAVKKRGWECVIHSTFSHMTDETLVSASAYDKWRAENGDDPGRYIREKKGYLARISDGAYILDEREGNYVIKHRPCPKYRVIFRLDDPWRAADFDDQTQANARWARRLHALAHALSMKADESCKDTSRLFFLPRRPNKDRAYEYEHVPGGALPIHELPDAPDQHQEQDLFSRPQSPPAAKPRAVSEHDKTWSRPGGQVNLTHWAVTHGGRFEIASALRSRKPDAFGSRRSGVKHHIQCPFDDEHTHPNDRTGTYVVNSSEIKRANLPLLDSGFYIGCKHDSCSGRDRLDFLAGMLDKGWIGSDDLISEQFLAPDPFAIVSPEVVETIMHKSEEAAKIKEAEGFPVSLTESLPGVMGDMIRYILDTSIKRQPVLALGATLVGMSAAIGRKVAVSGWGTRSNMYIVGIAHSGAGKDRPMSAMKGIIRHAGLVDKILGADRLASDAGLMTQVRLKPAHAMFLDEVGYLLANTADRNAGTHVKDIVPTLLSLYSTSDGLFQGKAYADETKNFWVNQPNVSLYGVSTPIKLYGSLRSEDISTGLLSRVVIFDAGDEDPLPSAPVGAEIPDSVIEWFQEWGKFDPSPPVAMEGGERLVDQMKVGVSAAATAVFNDFVVEMHEAKIAARKDETDTLFARANENALKFALVRACIGMPTDALEISEDCARWAVAISRSVTQHMARIACGRIYDNQYQRNMSSFQDALMKAGAKGLTAAEMKRKRTFQIPKREYDDIMGSLQESGVVAYLDTNAGRLKPSGGKIKPRMAYVWTGGVPMDDL